MSSSPFRPPHLLSSVSYGTSSVILLLFNKVVLSSYRFSFPFAMTLFHMLVMVIVLRVMRRFKLVCFPDLDWLLLRRAIPISVIYVGNIVLGMVGLGQTDIPMFSTLRRLTLLFVMIGEYLFVSRKTPQPGVVSAVMLMIFGSFIGGWGDLHFDLVGYGWVLLNNVFTAVNQVWLKKMFNETKLQNDELGTLYYMGLCAIPQLILCCLVKGEFTQVWYFPQLSNPAFLVCFTVSALMALFMNYSSFWCTKSNDALTTSVTGQVKNVLTSLFSLFWFGVSITPALVTGLSVGLSGSFLYGYTLYQNKKQADKSKDKEDEEQEHQSNRKEREAADHNHIKSMNMDGSTDNTNGHSLAETQEIEMEMQTYDDKQADRIPLLHSTHTNGITSSTSHSNHTTNSTSSAHYYHHPKHLHPSTGKTAVLY